MALTCTLQRNISIGGQLLRSSEEISADSQLAFDGTLAAAATDIAVDMDFAYADLKAVFISSTQDLTIKTNSSGTPTQTISIEAGVALIWSPADTFANPFTANVTGLYLTNGDADETAAVKIYILRDSTP